MPRRLRSLLGTGLALALGACLPEPPPWLGESGPHVGVVGDSLVHHAEYGRPGGPGDPRQLSGLLVAEGYRASLSSLPGADTPDLEAITSFPDPGADLLVVGLGTNDMARGTAVATAISNIEAFIDVIGPRCTVVITIVDEPSWGLEELGPQYNAALLEVAATRGDVVVADWLAIVEAHPEYLRSDGVHHTDEGQAAYRSLILAGVAECEVLVPVVAA